VILLATGAVVPKSIVKSAGFELTVSSQMLLIMGLAAVIYFELLAGIRSFADWQLYDIKNSASTRQLSRITKSLLQQASKYRLPFSHTAGSYRRPPRPERDPAQDRELMEQARHRRQLRYLENQRRSRRKRGWFFGNNLALVAARRLKFGIEIAFPLIVGISAIVLGAIKLHQG
jgi:hypothetical protein